MKEREELKETVTIGGTVIIGLVTLVVAIIFLLGVCLDDAKEVTKAK